MTSSGDTRQDRLRLYRQLPVHIGVDAWVEQRTEPRHTSDENLVKRYAELFAALANGAKTLPMAAPAAGYSHSRCAPRKKDAASLGFTDRDGYLARAPASMLLITSVFPSWHAYSYSRSLLCRKWIRTVHGFVHVVGSSIVT